LGVNLKAEKTRSHFCEKGNAKESSPFRGGGRQPFEKDELRKEIGKGQFRVKKRGDSARRQVGKLLFGIRRPTKKDP